MSGELFELACSVPWCITDEALEAMLRIAARDPLPEDETARRMHGPKALAARKGQRRDDSRQMTMRDSVAVISIDGPIYRYADLFTHVSGGVTTEALSRDFALAMDDPAVRGVLLVIDSPGGELTGVNELADTIYAARGQGKPIAAYVEGLGASAAYWIAAAADVVIADETAMLGSIGVVMGTPDPAKRVSRSIEFVSSQAPKKRADPTTDEGRAYYQGLVDDQAEVFIAKVARFRNIDPAAVLSVEGGMLKGQRAIDAGLADALGSEESTIRALTRGALPAFGPSVLRPFYPAISALLDMRAAQEESMPPEEKGKQSRGFFADLFAGARDAGLIIPQASADDPPLAPAATTTTAARTEPDPAHTDELAKLRAENQRLRAEQIQKDAKAFVAQHNGRTYPAEAAALEALYVRAAEIDQAHPRNDGQPACVALLASATAARPEHRMSQQLLDPSVKASVLMNNTGGDDGEIAQAKASATEYAQQANGKK